MATQRASKDQPDLKVIKGGEAPDQAGEISVPPAAWKPDDDVIATELAEKWKERVAFFHNEWRVLEGGVWRARDSSEFRRAIRGELRGWRARGVQVSQARIKGLAAMLEDDLYISDRRIMADHDERQKYIPLRNGLYNLDTFELEPHRPDLYFTHQLDFDYDEDADCPVFMRYLRSSLVLPGSADTDQSLLTLALEALGYSMTAQTHMKASFWLVGEKDSGKSTFIALIKNIMGDLYGTIDLTQLGVNRFLLSTIVGKRVIAFTEASGSAMLPDALYKALTGGQDEIYADVKNRDPITFRPEAKVWWAMNEMPRVSDRSGATTRRIVIIPFNRSIPEKDRITNLEGRLMAERSGIFNQMMVGWKRIVRQGKFSPCKQSEDRRSQYIQENDIELTYLQERLDLHEKNEVQSSELYQDYRGWCEMFGFRPKSVTQVAAEWRRLGLKDRKSSGLTVWAGARIRTANISAKL